MITDDRTQHPVQSLDVDEEGACDRCSRVGVNEWYKISVLQEPIDHRENN
jgi:hypothetical protein